ncbi:MAG: acetate--CoA ligase family protein, partial [Bacteroidales bacterium]|nr:acetate--CoA ligase family protein [Bacteroidales bacterium]
SIVVVGASNDISKPGGRVLKHILDGRFSGQVYTVNPKEDEIQGIRCYHNVSELPEVDLAVIAIAAKYAPDAVEVLTKQKNTRAIIIISAGFGEESHEGKVLEDKIVGYCNEVGAALIGPNCTGILTPYHRSIFSGPMPELDPQGCDFITGSGATGVFILEASIPAGLRFANVFTVGNSAQLGVEEILEHLDETFDPATSSRVKLLYIENIRNPKKLLKHAQSLIQKGCKIAAIKAGSSEAGSRAASSHTGALASSDVAVDALFRKAGIVRCYGRQDLMTVASIFQHPELKGKNIAIITHAGGPAVMLTDALSKAGLNVPKIDPAKAQPLKEQLFPGSSVANPIDFLATGTAEHLGKIIDACDNDFDEVDAMAVIFGTPGLVRIFDVYRLLDEKMKQAKKPIYPILPAVVTAREELEEFLGKNRINFQDEVVFGSALGRVFHTPAPDTDTVSLDGVDQAAIRKVIENNPDGYLAPDQIQILLDSCGVPRAGEAVVDTADAAVAAAEKLGYPLVMKVVGPVHKSDVGGVVLNVKDAATVKAEFERMIKIKDTTAILMQPMLSGMEIFAGVKYEPKFGHMILCGLGGIFIEVLKDVQTGLAPVTAKAAKGMIERLKGYKMLQGVRGQEGVNIEAVAKVVESLSKLVAVAPEIQEMDINPL